MMTEGIETPDGQKLDIDPAKADDIEQAFARAMSEPVGDDKQPPKRAERPAEPRQETPRVKRGRPPTKPPTGHPEVPKPLSRAARVEGIQGVAQVAGALLMFASTRVRNPVPLAADALVIANNAEQLAEAVAETAEHDLRFASVVDKLCAAGPYGALLAVGFTIGGQLARDHGLAVPGTTAPEDLIRAAQGEATAPMAA